METTTRHPEPQHRGMSQYEAAAALRRAWHAFTEVRAKVHPVPTYDALVAEHGADPLSAAS